MRQTSINIYNEVKASGLLSKMRLRVFEILCRNNYNTNDGLTAHEMRWVAENVYHMKNSEHLPKRLSELERQGVVEVTGARKCRRTGNNASVWSITGRQAQPLDKQLTPKEQRQQDAVGLLRNLWALLETSGCFSHLSESGEAIIIKRFEEVKRSIERI